MRNDYGTLAKLALLVLCGKMAWADNPATPASIPSHHFFLNPSAWVVTFSFGPSWESAGQSQTLGLTPEIEKTYDANHASHTLTTGEIFIGIQRPLSAKLQGQLGVAAMLTGGAPLSGDIWDDADPQFNNASYRYSVQHSHVALKAKLLADSNPRVMPWLSASAGVGFNRAYGYSNTPTSDEALATPNFASHTTTSLTYTLGAGVEHALTEQWKIGVGYEFADWGKSALGSAPGQTEGSGPSLNHLYTQSVLASMTYRI